MSLPPKKFLPISAVATEPANRLLSQAAGPVWPIRTDTESVALERLAQSFHGGLEEVSACAGILEPQSAETVIGLGTETWEAARLYGHLTRRPHRLLRCRGELETEERIAVAVVAEDRMEPILVEQLAERGWGESFVGVISGRSSTELRKQVLLRSASTRLSGPMATRRVDFWPLAVSDGFDLPSRRILGATSDPTRVRSALTGGAGLVSIFTHSNGINAYFGPLVLCSLRGGLPAQASGQRRPSCVVRDHCERLNLPLGEALLSQRLLPPSAISARLLLFHVCFGVLFPSSLVAPAWGLLRLLLDHGGVGAVVTHVGVIFADTRELEPLSQEIARGVPIGQALASFYKTEACRSKRLRPCLFGDPLTQLPSPIANENSAILDLFKNGSPESKSTGTSFTRGLLASVKATAKKLHEQRLVLQGFKMLSVLEDLPEKGAKESRRQARQAVLEALGACESLPSKLWLPLAERLWANSGSPGSCFACGSPTVEYLATLCFTDVQCRRLLSCPNCGIVDDAPKGAHRLGFRVVGPATIILEGHLPTSSAARILIKIAAHLDPVQAPWPTDRRGEPARTCVAPCELPPGVSLVALLLMSGTSLRFLRAPVCR